MTDQRKRFADKYFETLNGTQSAIYAGYSEVSAKSQASQLLIEPEVEEYLSALREEYQLKSGINKARILDEYRKIAFSDIRDILTVDGGLKDISELNDDAAAAVASIKSIEMEREGEKIGTNREIKLHDKLRALEALSRHLGLFEKDNDQKKVDLKKLNVTFK